MSPIKEKFLSLVQKTIVIFLAFLMLITMMPVGLFTGSDKDAAEGSFVRRLPCAEVSAKTSDGQARKIDDGNSVYYKFDISDLSDVKASEIQKVALRISFLAGSGTQNNIVNVYIVKPGDFPQHSNGLYNDLTELSCGTPIAKWYPYTLGSDDAVCEVDMAEYVKNALDNNEREICIRISSNSAVPILTGSAENTDEAYRPCLKSVTGIAEDTDADTLKKAELKEWSYVSPKGGNTDGNNMLLGGGNELYLKFDINKNAISGDLYSARLKLATVGVASENASVKVYVLNNSEWTASNINYENRPKGEEELALSMVCADTNVITADITQKICEAVNKGIYTLTLRVTADSETLKVFSGGDEKYAPKLYLKSTDREDISGVSDAALNVYGGNRMDYVTMNLTNSYVSKNRESVKISWYECDENGRELTEAKYISESGEITRPKWFESDAVVHTIAKFRCGDYSTRRFYTLKLPSETAPDYSKYKFSDYVNIGNSQSEEQQKFECKNVDNSKRRWANGSVFDYRVPKQDGIMVLNFACSPYDKNYLTLKLWEEDYVAPCEIEIKPYGVGKENGVIYDIPENGEVGDGGFVYATYALPESFTYGKNNVTLTVRFNYGGDERRGIYSAYLTQNPFFEPKQFTSKGEKSVSGFSIAEGKIRKFIYGIKESLIGSDEDTAVNSNTSDMPVVDNQTGSVVFFDENVNIVFETDAENGIASIYQSTDYYERYCAECPMRTEDGVVVVDYGGYTMIWNRYSSEEVVVSTLSEELSGVYNEMSEGEYYSFSEEWQMTDDSVVPEDKEVYDGDLLTVAPGDAILLRHIAEPMQNAQWRVNMVNGRSVSDISFGDAEKIEYINIKAIGGISDAAERLNVIVAVYENNKIISVSRKSADVYREINTYGIDFSDETLYMKSGRSVRIFVYDNTEDITKITPALELPLIDG